MVRLDRGSNAERRDRSRLRARPDVEGLEERRLLSGAGDDGSWTFPVRVTYSFVPDGTSIGGLPSKLNSAMAARGVSTATWQDQFRKAAAVWQQAAGINLVEVGDSGAAYSTSGNQQGDGRFGDIRIGGVGLSNGAVGLAFSPPPLNGGTLAGDIVFNTNIAWGVNSSYDIATVAIHEIGHALGLDHSSISSAVQYAYYNGTKQTLSGDDAGNIESVYDDRQADPFDAKSSNQSASSATDLTPFVGQNGKATIAGLDITTASDYDWYKVVAPRSTAGTLSVTMQSSGLSSLSPRIQIYDSSLKALSQATAANFYGATVTAGANNVKPGQAFYIRAMAANAGPTGAGAYGLSVNFAGGTTSSIAPPNTAVAQQPDRGGGSQGLEEESDDHGSVLGLVGKLLRSVLKTVNLITVGTLTGVGDELKVDPNFDPTGRRGPAGPVNLDGPAGSFRRHGHDAGRGSASRLSAPPSDLAPEDGGVRPSARARPLRGVVRVSLHRPFLRRGNVEVALVRVPQ